MIPFSFHFGGYTMRNDVLNWKPVSVVEAFDIFKTIPIKWAIAGGWALDLHIGKQTRLHKDIDIFIFRKDQLAVFNHLSKNWILYKAEKGELTSWNDGEFLNLTNDIWVCKDHKSPWSFQIMLVDSDKEDWIYRREKSIRKNIDNLYLKTKDGIPYLKPEIQLLYKSGSSTVREKDQNDFQSILPFLNPSEIEWLNIALQTQFPNGHPWIKEIESKLN